MRDTKQKLSPITIALHWVIAAAMIGMLTLGIYMERTESYSLYGTHKSIGIIIFTLIIARVIWRIINGWPQPASQYKKIEQILAKVTHYTLLIGTVMMPLSGLTMSIAGGRGAKIFGLPIVPPNYDPDIPDTIMAISKPLAGVAHQAHSLIGYIIIGALILHIAGALKHHVIDKDGTLRRMLGQKIDG